MAERGDSLIILAWTLTGIATVIVALRFLVCGFWIRRITADDYLMLLTLVSSCTYLYVYFRLEFSLENADPRQFTSLAHAALLIVSRKHGLGEHIWTLSPHHTK